MKLGDFYCPWKIKCASSKDFDINKLPLSSYPYIGGLKYVWPTSLEVYIPIDQIILKPDTRGTLYQIDEVPHSSIRFFVCPQTALNLLSQEISTYPTQEQLYGIPNNYKNGLSYQNILENLLKEDKKSIVPIIASNSSTSIERTRGITTRLSVEHIVNARLKKRQRYANILHIYTHNTTTIATSEGEIFREK